MKTKAILFVRVSTEQQQLESQEDSLRRAALSDGYTDDDIIVIGKKESAILLDEENRKGLQELKKNIQRGDIDIVYIFELSRLSRKPSILYSIREQLKDAGVQLKCLNPAFNLLTADRKQFDSTASFIFSLSGALAEQEMIEKKERFRRGKRKKAEDGKYSGGNIPFGYRVDPSRDNLIVIDDATAAIVKEVFNLYESGITQPSLAKEYHRRGNKKLTISFINNILNNERYTGSKRVYPGSSYPRSYPIIISPQQFEHCREIAKQNSTTIGKTRNVYYANRLIVCTECGCFWSASGSKVAYRCYDAFNTMRKFDHYTTPQCKSNLCISINIMDSLLWYAAQKAEVEYVINAAAEDKTKYEERIASLDQKLIVITDRLNEVDQKRARIVDSYIEGDLTKEKRDEKFQLIEAERKEILLDQVSFQDEKEHLMVLLQEISNNYNIDDVPNIVSHLDRIIALQEKVAAIDSDEERTKIIHRHIQKVTVVNSKVEYEFGIGKKIAPTRFITIYYYNGDIQYYHYIPNTGTGGVILSSTKEGKPIERVSFVYLDRFRDKGKIARRQQKKRLKMQERESKYPKDKFIQGYQELADFLNVSFSTATRWCRSFLKPAVVGKNERKIVVDKEKCLSLVKENTGIQ